MSRLAVPSSYAGHVLPSLLVVGLGMGFIFGAAMNVATAGADPLDAGVASALPNVAQQIGGALGPALLNTIATSAAASYLAGRAVTPAPEALASVHGDRMAFTVVYIILFASAVVSFFVLPRGRSPSARARRPSVDRRRFRPAEPADPHWAGLHWAWLARSTGPGSTGPGSTGPGSTGPGSTGPARTGRPAVH